MSALAVLRLPLWCACLTLKLFSRFRMAIILTVVCIPLAGIAVMADLGMPERAIVNLTQFVNPRSPFFGDFTLVISSSLISSVLFLFLTGRRDAAICAKQPGKLQWLYRVWSAGYKDTPEGQRRNLKASWWLALGILPIFITAQSTLGSVFGIQGGRPGWFGAIQAPVAIVVAMASGVGVLAVIAAVLRWTLGAKAQLNAVVFKWLGNILWVSVAAYLFLMVLELLASNYAGPSLDASVSQQLVSGQYAVIFWGSIALMVISAAGLFLQFVTNRTSITLVVLAGFMVNVAAIGKRLFTVVPSQTVGTMLPYLDGGYTPTWVEWGVAAGLFAIGTLLYVVVIKVFPAIEISESG